MRAFSLWAVVFLLGAATAQASESDETADLDPIEFPTFRVGIGIGLTSRPLVFFGDESTAGSPASFTNIQIPFYLGEHFRLEPEFGIFSQSGPLLPGNSLLGSLFDFGQVRTHVARFLLGLQWSTEIASRTIVYLGPKVGLQTRSMKFEVVEELEARDTKIKAVDFWLGATLGGEAFLTRNFSLGVEAGFYYLNQGESSLAALQDLLAELPDQRNASPWVLSTQGSIAARIYFL